MTDLKTCPFCGAEARTEVSPVVVGGGSFTLRAACFCPRCGCAKSVQFNANDITFEEICQQLDAAVEMWNRRADQ